MSTGENLEGTRRVCLVTGAGGTLGNAFCQRFVTDYDIVAVYRNRAPGVPSQTESFVDPLEPTADVDGGRVFAVRADLERDGEVERVVDLALARFGRVDLLVNNAALMGFHGAGIVDGEAALADFTRQFKVNVEVPMRLSVRIAQRFWTARAAENRAANRNVVNVSSTSGSQVYPGGQAVYSASKAALDHLTRHMSAEFASFGVRVNAVAPNSFPSIVPTEDVADAIVGVDKGAQTGEILALG